MGLLRRVGAAGAPLRWRLVFARRLPIVVLAAVAAAVPGGGPMAVSRVTERPGDDDRPTALGWENDEPADLFDDPLAGGSAGAFTLGGRVPRARLASALSPGGVPAVAMRAYVRSQETMAVNDPSCGLRWSLVAAIGKVESDHGRFGGSQLLEDGTTTRPIRGQRLDGRGDVAHIADTDDGRLDGDRVYDRAVGPMQFIPSSWRRVASDGNDDGRSDPDNIFDAALAAGVYLCAGDTDLRDQDDLLRAVLRYNRSYAYAATVLELALAYERGQHGPLPPVGPSLTPPAAVGTRRLPPANPGPTPSLQGERDATPSSTTTRPSSTTTDRPSTTRAPSSSTTVHPTTTHPTSTTTTTSSSTTTSMTTSTTTSTSTTTTSTTTTTRPPTGPVLHQVTAGLLPSGPWSLWARAASADDVALEMRLPATIWREAGPLAELASRWTVTSADGRHLIWGLTPGDVATVVVTLSDGRVVPVPTVEAGLDDVDDVRAFAAPLPEGLAITAIHGTRADGTVAVQGQNVTRSLEPVAGFDPTVSATVPIAAAPAG